MRPQAQPLIFSSANRDGQTSPSRIVLHLDPGPLRENKWKDKVTMFSRSLLRKFAADLRVSAPSTISGAVPHPQRACLHQTASQEPPSSQLSSPKPDSPLSATPRAQTSQPTANQQTPPNTFIPQNRSHVPDEKRAVAPEFKEPLKVTRSLMERLPHLVGQAPHYVVAKLHNKPYLLTPGDQVRLPFLMPKVQSGDILRFNRASALGSRDFTLKGNPHIDERLFECRVRVTGTDAEPLRIKEKTKRRQRHVQQIRSKERYTVMRVMEVRVKTPEELLQEGAVIVEEGEDSPAIEAKV
ncbi:hypothetical protein N7474_005827 [Penicillium riverlandense]|uniref:uncharacterized protein n=1 Tax=Penicillium riverlandense TaxID=1903569 RepID=UPI002547EE01|nr:uncharacterized protein N7474_005827 [Penicillium riverlandense]KAJ5820236.1 hypothetical protein N7474_005827 [Penicillium riverlandense]